MQDLDKAYRKMVEDTGAKIGMDSDSCVLYKVQHGNCKGCEYELGCCKYVGIRLINLMAVQYQSKDFEDSLKTMRKLTDTVNKILEAKTSKEVHDLI